MRIIQTIFIRCHAPVQTILSRCGVSKFQEIPGTSRYIADAWEFHVRRISWSALMYNTCTRAYAWLASTRFAALSARARSHFHRSILNSPREFYGTNAYKNYIFPPRCAFPIRAQPRLAFRNCDERKTEGSTARFLTCVPQVSILPANQARHSARKTAGILRPGCRIGSVRRSM